MSQSLSPAPSGQRRLTLHRSRRGISHPLPVTDPYDRCYYAVCAQLMGKPGLLTALQAIVAAKANAGGARHD